MNAQMFLENFGPIANAPGGVKRLREMILHYAVSGKLVAQIDSDGNAEQDIERANFLREEFQQRFKIRNRKPIESPRNEEIPFSIPKNWKWTRMESIACYIQRGKGPMYAASGQALVVSQKCIQWSGFDLTPARRINDESLRQYGDCLLYTSAPQFTADLFTFNPPPNAQKIAFLVDRPAAQPAKAAK